MMTVADLAASRSLAEEGLAQAAHAIEQEWNDKPLNDLVDHILTVHHRPLIAELPRLGRLVEKVTSVHDDTDPEQMTALRGVWQSLVADLEPHIEVEERVLFPWIRNPNGIAPAGPIEVMEADHERVGDLLRELRRLTNDYVVPANACGSWRALWQGLDALDEDLHRHIHLENNILFPRALNR